MKTFSMKCLAWVFAASLFLLGASPALADRPRMRAAIDLLQEAKKSAKPLPLLKQAKEKFKEPKQPKKSNRTEAMAAIDDAIALAIAGNKSKMEQKINHAIAQIHSRMDDSR